MAAEGRSGRSRRSGERAAIMSLLTALNDDLRRSALADLLVEALPAGAAARLLRAAHEDPYALASLARSVTAPRPVSPSESVPRLPALPMAAHRFVLAAAADEQLRITEFVAVARSAGLDVSALSAAEDAGIMRVLGAVITFTPPWTREDIYATATLAERCEAHVLAAAAAADAGEHVRAARSLESAAALTVDPADAARRYVAAARHAWQAGDQARARDLLGRAHVVDGHSDVAGEFHLLAGEIELRSGAPLAALESLLAAADMLADNHRRLAAHTLLRAVEAACFAGRYGVLADIASRAAALQRDDDADDLVIVLEYLTGASAAFLGRPDAGADPLRRCAERGAKLGEPTALVLASAASMVLADHPAMWRLASAAAREARSRGQVSVLPMALLIRGQAEYFLGRHAAAEATCWEGWRAARAGGQLNYASEHRAMLAVFAAIRGDEDECRGHLQRLSLPPGADRLSRPTALAQWALAVLDVTAGRSAEAVDRLTSLIDPRTGDSQIGVLAMAAPWLIEAAARAGDLESAAGWLVGLDAWAAGGAPLIQALSARCHALLASPGGTEAIERFTEALRLHRAADSEFEEARTELLFGEHLRRERRPSEAREHLRRARETFDRLELGSWTARADAELRAAGERVAVDTGLDALTPQQRHIARLVATGATNREVAAQLYLSPRTVDHHLRNIFTRLNIRSRVELVHLVPPSS